ncbi:hypothetical protein [Pseudovibrio exalbescens]|uniref:hypothetical protein n=1 Tax=Pseudovibrio exalbescens TaxID=197461 RepID=UPI000C9BFDA8|nr:hypothetical protein [Pseudovibrio exalbescens]
MGAVNLIWKVLSSRAGLAVMTMFVLFTWHKLDKGSAVRTAVAEYVAADELATARALNKALSEKLEKERAAAQAFELARQRTALEAAQLAEEIAAYEKTSSVPVQCVVSDQLVERLRAN